MAKLTPTSLVAPFLLRAGDAYSTIDTNIATVAASMTAVAAHPAIFQRVLSTSVPMICGRLAATMTAAMMGTEITAFSTAAQYSALIGFQPKPLRAAPIAIALPITQ